MRKLINFKYEKILEIVFCGTDTLYLCRNVYLPVEEIPATTRGI